MKYRVVEETRFNIFNKIGRSNRSLIEIQFYGDISLTVSIKTRFSDACPLPARHNKIVLTVKFFNMLSP